MRAIVSRGLQTGAVLAASTAGAMMIASSFERGSPWAGLNAMATAIGAGGRRPRDRFDPAVTPVGIAILSGGLLAWGLLYEGALAATRRRSTIATGALSGALAYAFDRLALPSWVVQNFRRTMGLGGTIAKYATVGLASAASARLARATRVERSKEEAISGEVLEELGRALGAPSRAEPRGRRDRIEDEYAAVQRPPADS